MRVTTRRGSIELTARADMAVQEGTVFIPFAYVEAAANILTNPQLDPYGKIPEYKYCAVKIGPAQGKPQRVPEPSHRRDSLGPLAVKFRTWLCRMVSSVSCSRAADQVAWAAAISACGCSAGERSSPALSTG